MDPYEGSCSDDEDEDENILKGTTRFPDKVNEFLAKDTALTATFPHIFTLGQSYKRAVGKLSTGQVHHLLHQFTMVPSQDRRLLAYLADSKLRFDAICGVNAYVECNTHAKTRSWLSLMTRKNLHTFKQPKKSPKVTLQRSSLQNTGPCSHLNLHHLKSCLHKDPYHSSVCSAFQHWYHQLTHRVCRHDSVCQW